MTTNGEPASATSATSATSGPADEAPAPGVGGPRSARTRRVILDVARGAFAARGYERTTIRAVAAEAGIDPSMVIRYFGSKAGLFTAASTRDLRVPDLTTMPPDRRGERLVRHFLEMWELRPSDDSLVFLLRTAATNEDVAGRMQATFNGMIAEPVAALGVPDAGRRAALIGTQLLGIALCRYILRLEPLASLGVEEIVAGAAPAVQLQLA